MTAPVPIHSGSRWEPLPSAAEPGSFAGRPMDGSAPEDRPNAASFGQPRPTHRVRPIIAAFAAVLAIGTGGAAVVATRPGAEPTVANADTADGSHHGQDIPRGTDGGLGGHHRAGAFGHGGRG